MSRAWRLTAAIAYDVHFRQLGKKGCVFDGSMEDVEGSEKSEIGI